MAQPSRLCLKTAQPRRLCYELSHHLELSAAIVLDLSQLRGITGIEELPDVPPIAWERWLVAGMLVAVGIIAGLWRIRRRQRFSPAPLTPAQLALRELDRLQTTQGTATADRELFAGAVADVIRRFLEGRFGLHAPRQTTGEFFGNLPTTVALDSEQQQLLRSLLERCDLAKFAAWNPSDSQCRELVATARGFVTEVEQRPFTLTASAETITLR